MSSDFDFGRHRIFLSIRGQSGQAAASELVAAWTTQRYGTEEDFWAYHIHSNQGANVSAEYRSRIHNSHYYVPILTREFCTTSSEHIQTEIDLACDIQSRLNSAGSDYQFIVPFLADSSLSEDVIPFKLRNLGRRGIDRTVETLRRATSQNEGREVFERNPRRLSDWPHFMFGPDGIDAMFVLGHTKKEGSLIQSKLEEFHKWGLGKSLEKEGTQQSLRPAQMIPKLQRYLHQRQLGELPTTSPIALQDFPCEIDRHLINFRTKSLSEHNIICLGAGDTNWISRALQQYYRHVLLSIRFESPQSSQAILITTRDHESETAGRLTLAGIGSSNENGDRVLDQVEPDDDRFSALIVVLPNPWNSKKTAVLCAGLTGLGTQAAMLALCDPEFSQKMGNRPNTYAVVIKGKEEDWLPTAYEIVY